MTWPQALVFNTHAYDHYDVFFNLWRLRWIAHALATSPFELFNGNIFLPDPGVLAYSDAMLVEGVLAAGVIFAFAPYRFEHYMHMELQWTVWCPWAFWALQRTLETGSIGFGL